jgi:hypothetical protein
VGHHGTPAENRDRERSQERSQEQRLTRFVAFATKILDCTNDFVGFEGLSWLMYSIPASAESPPVLPQAGDSLGIPNSMCSAGSSTYGRCVGMG